MKTIRLPYTPDLEERIFDILRCEYPDKKVSKLLHQIRIRQNALRSAQILVLHNPKKNVTQINVSAASPYWVYGTIIIPILLIILLVYGLSGNWATEITETLKKKIPTRF